MHTMTFSGKRGHHSEGEWGGIHGRVWRQEMEGGNNVIKL